jgi:hypothetical protein
MSKVFRKVPSDVEQATKHFNHQSMVMRESYETSLEKLQMILESREFSLHQMDAINQEKQFENDRLRMMLRSVLHVARICERENRKFRKKFGGRK